MKVTYNWIKELVDITAPVKEVADRLTSTGLEVASLEPRSIPDGVIVAEIVEAEKHPDSDHLFICKVDTGKSKQLTVVCGAPNTKTGMKGALATVGTVLDPDFEVKKAAIRGVESMGMLCSERELGISDNHEGIISLPKEYKTGDSINKYIENDTVIDIDLTPNRGDCLSVLGVAREVSAIYNIPVKNTAPRPQESEDPVDNYIKVTIEDAEGCPRYMGRLVRGVTIKESPLWLKNRLSALGIRPISNVVDVTNYILLLFGQPMHSFDYKLIAGNEIIVKRAKSGQKFITLDEIERSLTSEDLLICDGKGPTAIAGIMGGLASGITDYTTDVFLECAYFNPEGIRKTSKRLGLSSDSSYRFERGVDPVSGCENAIDTAAEMIRELAGGSIAKGVIDTYPNPIPKKQITLRPSKVARLLGVSIEKDSIISLLSSLQIDFISENNEKLLFEAPQFRHDIELEVDLIEEIGRLHGYDNIPTEIESSVVMDHSLNPGEKIVNTIRKSLAGTGLHEAVTNTMTSEKKCTLLTPAIEPIELLNPLNPDMSRMRTTLLGSLLDITSYNINRKNSNNRFFEIGKSFIKRNNAELPDEPDIVAILIEGEYMPGSWNSGKQETNFYIIKGFVESLQTSLSLPEFTYTPLKDTHSYFSKESAQVKGRGITGLLGKIRNEILESFSIKTPVYYAELDITELLKHGLEDPIYSQLPPYPAIKRDLCFVMEEKLLSSKISDEIYSLSDLVESVKPFDIYRGEKLTGSMKSIAYSIQLRAEDRTLTDEEAEDVCSNIINTIKSKFNAVLRE